jgi:hypothetical protein
MLQNRHVTLRPTMSASFQSKSRDQWSETKLGTPQGAVASPLIANVYLHYLFDLWADVWRKKVAKGDVIVVPMPTILSWAFSTEQTPNVF